MAISRIVRHSRFAASVAVISLCAASPAWAQDPPSAADDDEETIVVTAQKRSQTLIEIPQSITVVNGGTLEEQHADSFEDYVKLVPGLQLNQGRPGEGRLVLRGINTGGVASTVGIYMDETPFGSSSGLVNGAVLAGDFDTFDLDRIEVLRGPQGTIYGASALSGVLRFVTNEPSTTETIVRARGGVESTDNGDMSYYTNAAVNVPLSDNVAFRASGTFRKNGGFVDSIGTGGSDIENNINDNKVVGGRASLLVRPSDMFSIRLTALAQNIESDAPSTVEADPDTLEILYGDLTRSQFGEVFSDLRYRVYNATGIVDLGFGELTSSTSYSTQKQNLLNDYTFALAGLIEAVFGTPNEFIQFQDTDSKKFTQEVRLSGESDMLDWLVGGFYTNEKGLIFQDFQAVTPGTTTPINGLPLLGLATIESKYREFAGFVNLTVHLGERFDVDLGGRYSENKQRAQQELSGFLVGGSQVFPETHSKEDVFTYSVAPRFEINDNASVYARVAKGFRPGGVNLLPPGAPPELASYASDTVISYEVGVKAQTADRVFSIDAAVFHIDWDDIQLIATINNVNVNANGGKAKSDGFEFTATVRPVPGLTVSANGAFVNAKLKEDTEIGGLDGDRLPYTPKFAGALNVDYNWNVSADIEAHLGGSVRHVSGQSATFDEDFRTTFGRQRRIPSYSVIDLSAGLDFGKFNVDAYVQNLGNSHGRTSNSGTDVFGGFPLFPNGALTTGIIRPRTFGLSVGVEL